MAAKNNWKGKLCNGILIVAHRDRISRKMERCIEKRNQILAGVLAVLLGVSPSGVYGEAFYDVEDVVATDAAAQEITEMFRMKNRNSRKK